MFKDNKYCIKEVIPVQYFLYLLIIIKNSMDIVHKYAIMMKK